MPLERAGFNPTANWYIAESFSMFGVARQWIWHGCQEKPYQTLRKILPSVILIYKLRIPFWLRKFVQRLSKLRRQFSPRVLVRFCSIQFSLVHVVLLFHFFFQVKSLKCSAKPIDAKNLTSKLTTLFHTFLESVMCGKQFMSEWTCAKTHSRKTWRG